MGCTHFWTSSTHGIERSCDGRLRTLGIGNIVADDLHMRKALFLKGVLEMSVQHDIAEELEGVGVRGDASFQVWISGGQIPEASPQ